MAAPSALAIDKMPLAEPPPRGTRFGSPLVLSRVHWVRPEMVVEVSYVEWTGDGLLRHVVYQGERGDKLATEPPKCTAANLMPAILDPGKADSIAYQEQSKGVAARSATSPLRSLSPQRIPEN
jgi:hypothetical protein